MIGQLHEKAQSRTGNDSTCPRPHNFVITNNGEGHALDFNQSWLRITAAQGQHLRLTTCMATWNGQDCQNAASSRVNHINCIWNCLPILGFMQVTKKFHVQGLLSISFVNKQYSHQIFTEELQAEIMHRVSRCIHIIQRYKWRHESTCWMGRTFG